MKDKNLYKVFTRRLGEFYVVTTSWDLAAEAVSNALEEGEYGFSDDRIVTKIEILRTEHFFNGSRFFCGPDDINKFIVVNEEN